LLRARYPGNQRKDEKEMYKLNREIIVAAKPEKVWKFLSTPKNLNELTPRDLSFKILSDLPDEMYNGLIIEYKIKIPLAGTWHWITEIKHIREGKAFVDEQRKGPYKFWYHFHEIKEVSGGTKIIDTVHYDIPFSIAGKLMHSIFIKNKLNEIFDFRSERFEEILNNSGG
jgi:ligand-binding SRPBCC domain-containing protein